MTAASIRVPRRPARTAGSGPAHAVRSGLAGWAFLLPTVASVVAVSVYPVIRSIQSSFTNATLGGNASRGVALKNYRALLDGPDFVSAWWHTIWFTFATTLLETLLGLVFALLLNEAFKGRGFVRAVVIIPWAIPTVVSAKMIASIVDGSRGPLNYILTSVGLVDQNVNFLGQPGTAMWTMIAADVWKSTPFMALLLLAGLQTMPGSLLEAAQVDGASRIGTFFSIRLPLLMPALLVAALLRALDAFRIFDLPYILTGGGPASSTETLSTIGYKTMFSALQVGYGSAITTLMFLTEAVIAILFGLFILRQSRKLN